MSEEFLHFLWKFKLIKPPFILQNGEEMHIIKAGIHNHDAGPDFFNAMIKTGSTTWAGNVEIHVMASDWFKHQHEEDPAYDNIILHVVFQDDTEIYRQNGEIIPCLQIEGKYDQGLYNKYLEIITSNKRIPCENMLAKIDNIVYQAMLEKALVERLEDKSVFILNKLIANNNNWEQSFYEHLASGFGMKVNAEAFEMLAKSLPVQQLAKHKNDLLQVEAMLYGQAGFLQNKFKDAYPKALQKEHTHLKKKFGFKPIPQYHWKFLRLRPSNFPGIRISQFAALVHKSSALFSKILEMEDANQIEKLFDVEASEYWQEHYRFDHVSKGQKKTKRLGKEAIRLIMINTIVPFLFVYGMQKSDDKFCKRALALLEQIKAEKNRITKLWIDSKIELKSAFESQALIQLFNNYCRNKKCLDCKIGVKVLNS